jgi:protein involved in temperature-dependent protein secretion
MSAASAITVHLGENSASKAICCDATVVVRPCRKHGARRMYYSLDVVCGDLDAADLQIALFSQVNCRVIRRIFCGSQEWAFNLSKDNWSENKK